MGLSRTSFVVDITHHGEKQLALLRPARNQWSNDGDCVDPASVEAASPY